MDLSYFRFSMEGKAISPIATCPDTQVPCTAPIKPQMPMLPIPSPPLTPPIHLYIMLYRSSAIPDLASMYPIKINAGKDSMTSQ